MTAGSGPPANRPASPAAADRPCKAAEDRLESLLSDPIVQLLMERDGVERDVLLRMARTVRRRAVVRDDGRPLTRD